MSVFLGRSPGEKHVHPDGTVTTVEREPLWTDGDREAAYALYDDEADRCPLHGGPLSECEEATDLYPARRVCLIAAAQSMAERRRATQMEGVKPDINGQLETDGEQIYLSRTDPDPDHDFLNPVKGVLDGDTP